VIASAIVVASELHVPIRHRTSITFVNPAHHLAAMRVVAATTDRETAPPRSAVGPALEAETALGALGYLGVDASAAYVSLFQPRAPFFLTRAIAERQRARQQRRTCDNDKARPC